jgi:predicted Zn-dependent protease
VSSRRSVVVAGRILLASALAFSVLAGCSRNPVTGRPEMVLISTEEEVKVGREEAKKVEVQMGFADLQSARSYVQRIGKNLAVYSPRMDVNYTFDVVDMPEPNAFALPGGPVYVSRGLLALANSEDELAGVIGHEIGHIAARHVVQRVSATAPFAILVGIPAAIVGSVSKTLGAVVAAPGALAGGLVLASHSRGQEKQADRIGMDLATHAGYDPAALGRFLATLQREEELARGERRRTHFFDSHPATAERVVDAQAYAVGLQRASAAPVAQGRAGMLRRVEGLMLGENPSAGVFLDNRFVHPAMGFSVDFPHGWKTSNQPSFVVGLKPDSDQKVFAVLQQAAEGKDPREGPKADGIDEKLLPQLQVKHVNGLPTTRFETRNKGMTYLLAWIAHSGTVYRIACVAPDDQWPQLGPACEAVVGSFAPLSSADRGRIRESRLRVVTATGGERLSDVLARSGNVWQPEKAALANALEGPAARLSAGTQVKVSVSRPYRGR